MRRGEGGASSSSSAKQGCGSSPARVDYKSCETGWKSSGSRLHGGPSERLTRPNRAGPHNSGCFRRAAYADCVRLPTVAEVHASRSAEQIDVS